MTAPLIEGETVRFGGRDWVVPPLSLGAVRRLEPVLTTLGTAPEGATSGLASLDGVLTVVHASLVRNYPDLTVEALADAMELPALESVIRAVLRVSGLVQPGTDGAESAAAGNG